MEYTLLKPDCHSWWISKMQSGRENTLEESYAIKFCFQLGKNATETYGMLQTSFEPSCMNWASVFEWHKRFKEDRESVRDDGRCGRSKEVKTTELIGQIKNFMDKDCRVSTETIRAQFDVSMGTVHIIICEELKIGSVEFPPGQCISRQLLVTDYLTKMGIKIIPHLLPVTFGYSLSSRKTLEAVVMRQLRRWKRLWRGSLTRSHKRTSLGPSRSC